MPFTQLSLPRYLFRVLHPPHLRSSILQSSILMSPLPIIPAMAQLSVLEAVDAVAYIAVGYLLCGLINNYFLYYREWIVALLIVPASISGKGFARAGAGLSVETSNVERTSGGQEQNGRESNSNNSGVPLLKEG